jgi:hypothetical protein
VTRKSRTIIATGRGRARRRGSRRSTPINIKVSLAPKRRKASRKRRASPKRRHHARRHRHAHYTPASHQLAADSYALSNPLSGGELVLLALTGTIGYGVADFVGRYMETTATSGGAANSVPTGATVANDVATTGWPSWQAGLSQLGIAAVPIIGASFVDSPWGRASLQGFGLGAGAALFGNLFRNAMASLIGSTALGQQLYLAEYEAQAQMGTGTAATTTTGLSGVPRGRRMVQKGVGTAVASMVPGNVPSTVVVPRISQPVTRNPVAPSSNIPSYNASTPPGTSLQMPPGIVTNGGDVVASPPPGTPIPGGAQAGASCAPCSSTMGGIAGTYDTAVNAIRDESCLGKIPGGFYGMFPEN